MIHDYRKNGQVLGRFSLVNSPWSAKEKWNFEVFGSLQMLLKPFNTNEIQLQSSIFFSIPKAIIKLEIRAENIIT